MSEDSHFISMFLDAVYSTVVEADNVVQVVLGPGET